MAVEKRRIKAVFFGMFPTTTFLYTRINIYQPATPSSSPLFPFIHLADLDDTLVLTKDADVRAYQRVTAIAKQSHPSIDEDKIIKDWRHLFAASPWDPEGQVS